MTPDEQLSAIRFCKRKDHGAYSRLACPKCCLHKESATLEGSVQCSQCGEELQWITAGMLDESVRQLSAIREMLPEGDVVEQVRVLMQERDVYKRSIRTQERGADCGVCGVVYDDIALIGLGLEDNWRETEQYDTLSELVYYLRMDKEVTIKERDQLQKLLGEVAPVLERHNRTAGIYGTGVKEMDSLRYRIQAALNTQAKEKKP